MKTKKCVTCGINKPIEEMVKSKAYKDGIMCYCKKCMKIKSLKFRVNNPLQQMLSGTKSSAKKRNIEFTLTLEDIAVPEYCKYLGLKLTNETGQGLLSTAATIDRIDNNKGYTKDNIQIISHQANKLKESLSIEQLIMFAENILLNHKC